jgi:hypothetical protein
MSEIFLPYIPPFNPNNDVLSLPALRDGAISATESGVPHKGYPHFETGKKGGRLFMTQAMVLEAASFEEAYERSDGTWTKVTRIELPPGHDTHSVTREHFLSAPQNHDTLIYPAVPDIVTGSNDEIDDDTFQRFLDSGYTIFDQHNRPLPGSFDHVMQLLSLLTRGDSGKHLGMPVGNGTFSSPGSHPAADTFPMMPMGQGSDELAVLVYGRSRTDQSPEVLAPPGGFGTRLDIGQDGRYSPQLAIARLCLRKAAFDISEFISRPVHTEFALSSPTTINARLIAEGYLTTVPYSADIEVHPEIPTDFEEGAFWVAASAIVRKNTALRRASTRSDYSPDTPDQIMWSTHMRHFIASNNTYRQLQSAGEL